MSRPRRPGQRDLELDPEPGFDVPARMTRLEQLVAAQRETITRVCDGFGALLALLERRMGELDVVRRAAAGIALDPAEPVEPEAPVERVPLAVAAARLGRSPATVRRWCEKGRLSGARIEPLDRGGRRWTIPEPVVRDRERSHLRAPRPLVG